MTTIHIMHRGEEWTCDVTNIGGLVVIAPRPRWEGNGIARRDPTFGRLEIDAHELGDILDD